MPSHYEAFGNVRHTTGSAAAATSASRACSSTHSPELGGLGVPFDDRSTIDLGEIVAWVWDFGDGGVSGRQHPHHAFPGPSIWHPRFAGTHLAWPLPDVVLPRAVTEQSGSDAHTGHRSGHEAPKRETARQDGGPGVIAIYA